LALYKSLTYLLTFVHGKFLKNKINYRHTETESGMKITGVEKEIVTIDDYRNN